MVAPVLILPGIGGSGPEHWQSRWQALHPEYRRIEMPDWERPERGLWVSEVEKAVHAAPGSPVIVAHSLGCLVLAHFAARGGQVRAALLVAVPDPESPEYPDIAKGFQPVPLQRFGFASRVVASRNDPYGSYDFAARCATAWGSALSDVGSLGHINADSGLGDWPHGAALLAGLLA